MAATSCPTSSSATSTTGSPPAPRSTRPDATCSIEFIDESPSAPTFADHPEVRRLVDAGVAHVEPKQAWTDVARFARIGVPAVNWGPGVNAQAHQRNEYTLLSLLDEGAEIVRRWLTAQRPPRTPA